MGSATSSSPGLASRAQIKYNLCVAPHSGRAVGVLPLQRRPDAEQMSRWLYRCQHQHRASRFPSRRAASASAAGAAAAQRLLSKLSIDSLDPIPLDRPILAELATCAVTP